MMKLITWQTPTPNYSSKQFSLFRILLGLFAAYFFSALIPYGGEFFSSSGVFPHQEVFNWIYFPGIFKLRDSIFFVNCILILAIFLSLLFSCGICRKTTALFIWYIIASLVNRNPFIQSFSFDYLGLLFLASTLVPCGESYLNSNKNFNWWFPKILYECMGYVLAINYTFSGLSKILHEKWLDGSAVIHTLLSGLGRDNFLNNLLAHSSPFILQILCWIVLIIEIIYLPCFIWSKSRKWIWLGMVLIHIGIAFTTYITKMSITIILFHIFIFPTDWSVKLRDT